MRSMLLVLTHVLVFSAYHSTALGGTDWYMVPEGVYVNDAEPNSACSVEVKKESAFWNTYSVTVFRESSFSRIPDSLVKSDSFSLRVLEKQVIENDGQFLIVTKKTSSKTNKIKGRFFEQNGSLFWDVSVMREACLGFCTSRSAQCTVQVPN